MESSSQLNWSYIARRTHWLERCEKSSFCFLAWDTYLSITTGIQLQKYLPTPEIKLLLMFYDTIYETEYDSLKYCDGKEI